jgi:hypothetical protein
MVRVIYLMKTCYLASLTGVICFDMIAIGAECMVAIISNRTIRPSKEATFIHPYTLKWTSKGCLGTQ